MIAQPTYEETHRRAYAEHKDLTAAWLAVAERAAELTRGTTIIEKGWVMAHASSIMYDEKDGSYGLRFAKGAAKRLKHVKAEDRVLYVPQWDMARAEIAMRKAGVNGAVSNLCGSQRKRVKSGKGG